MAARSVHSTVYDPEGKTLDPQVWVGYGTGERGRRGLGPGSPGLPQASSRTPAHPPHHVSSPCLPLQGDDQLRSTYSACMQQLLADQGARSVRDILDIGAATGLSSLALLKAFPGAHITGIDLSPHMLAVGSHLQRQWQAARAAAGQPPEALRFVHGAGEDTRLPDASMDLVSVMLVCHELPVAASQAIFREAFRVLRPGGALSVMEMNPASPVFQRIFSNPFPYVAFKSTVRLLLCII